MMFHRHISLFVAAKRKLCLLLAELRSAATLEIYELISEKIRRLKTSVDSFIAPKVSPVIPPIFLVIYLVKIRTNKNMLKIKSSN